MLFERFLVICLIGLGAVSCGKKAPGSVTAVEERQAASPVFPMPAAEPWSTKPVTEWPQLVLTNSATFKGHTPLQGASSFLVKGPDGTIYAAAADHLLGPNGGVTPTLAQSNLDRALESWRMYPRTKDDLAISITGLGIQKPTKEASDWLLLKVKSEGTKLPSTPLALRPTPVEIGEVIFVAAVPYSQPDRAQNVYRGRVTQREAPDWFRYVLEVPENIVGFSGAPVLDKNGLVVGVMTIWFEPKMSGDKFMEGGGQDASYIAKRPARKP